VRTGISRRPPEAPAGISLLMLLGVYVLERGSTWQEALAHALQALGYTRHAARQSIARAIRAGQLETTRQGRRALVSLTPDGIELLRDGERRMFTFGQPWSWDGSWLLVSLRVPEAQREVRHRLRKRLGWMGFGSLGNGLWLSPHVDREGELAAALAQEPAAEVWTFRARHGELGDRDRLVRSAWDIDAMVASYERFVADFGRTSPGSPQDAFTTLISMLVRWRSFPFADPDLPPELLPKGWLRERAHDLFHDRFDRWVGPSRSYVASLEPEGARLGTLALGAEARP
jgi:phenylacetic acid degradation operon negative regulatory protein